MPQTSQLVNVTTLTMLKKKIDLYHLVLRVELGTVTPRQHQSTVVVSMHAKEQAEGISVQTGDLDN
jgi:hypothetical protein